MGKTFREALLEIIESKDEKAPSLRAIAKASGVSYEQLKKIKQRPDATTNVDDAKAVANALGMTLDEFLDDRTIEDRVRLVEQYNRLSDAERKLLRKLAEE